MTVYFIISPSVNNEEYQIHDVALGEEMMDELGNCVAILTGEFEGNILEYVDDDNIFGVVEADVNALIRDTESTDLDDWATYYTTSISGRVLRKVDDAYQVAELDQQSENEFLEDNFEDPKDLFIFRVFKDGILKARRLSDK